MLNLATQINRRVQYLKKYHPPRSSTLVDNSERLLKVYGGSNAHEAQARLVQIAKRTGLPSDSLSRFLAAGYVPQPMQVRSHAACRECDKPDGPTQVGIGGARGPGKSHGVFAQAAIDDCQRFPGLKVLYLRLIQKNAKEQFADLRLKALLYTPHRFANSVLHFNNGSRLFLGHFKNESDIDQYLGIEYDLIVIEELTTLSLLKYRALRDSNRTSKTGYRPRIYATFNPGGTGHAWVKKLFVEPERQGKQKDTRFIRGTVDDNVFNNPEYVKNLEENAGWRLRAYRYGDWDIAAGQFFSTWRRERIVKPGLAIMPGAEVWASLDHGYQHPTCAYLFSEYDGKVQVIDEHWRRFALPSENAEDIKKMLARHDLKASDLQAFVAGHDVFADRGEESKRTIAAQYEQHGIKLSRANNDRVNGAARLLDLLGRDEARTEQGDDLPAIPAQIEISDRCPKLIENIPTLQHDPNRPEDVLKVNIDEDGNGGDDPYDAVRYGTMRPNKRQLGMY